MTHTVIDCRIEPGRHGGIEQAMRGIVAGLSGTTAESSTVTVLAWDGLDDWIRPSCDERAGVRLHTVAAPASRSLVMRARTTRVGSLMLERSQDWRSRRRPIPTSDGVIESLDADLVHFAHQGAVLTDRVSIYEPWDLQHLHLPELFTEAERDRRERWYRAFVAQAEQVVVHNNTVRADLIMEYGIEQSRISVVPMGSVLQLIDKPSVSESRRRRHQLAVPMRYAIYPAQAWPHKNHRGLIDAVAQLRGRGMDVPVVCPGATLGDEALRAYAREAGVADLVILPGRVSDPDLAALYAGARCMVFPSTYEGFGLPIVEAFDAGIAVVCSGIDALAELVGNAAHLVDPFDAESIAHGIETVWQDDDVAEALRERGRQRARLYTWEATGRAYRTIYDEVAAREMVA